MTIFIHILIIHAFKVIQFGLAFCITSFGETRYKPIDRPSPLTRHNAHCRKNADALLRFPYVPTRTCAPSNY